MVIHESMVTQKDCQLACLHQDIQWNSLPYPQLSDMIFARIDQLENGETFSIFFPQFSKIIKQVKLLTHNKSYFDAKIICEL